MLETMAAYAIVALIASSAPAQQPATAPATVIAEDPYAPYVFLIGDWHSTEAGNTLRQSFRWGPSRSYILYSTYMQQPGKPERLHFEGIMVWNGRTRVLDYVFAVEPGSGVQEKGTIRVGADGSVVREVEFTGANGSVSHFRQTIRKTGPDAAVTSLMRRSGKGWEPNFPGSERIVMRRHRD